MLVALFLPDLITNFNFDMRPLSSVGSSAVLVRQRSWVRFPKGPINLLIFGKTTTQMNFATSGLGRVNKSHKSSVQ